MAFKVVVWRRARGKEGVILELKERGGEREGEGEKDD